MNIAINAKLYQEIANRIDNINRYYPLLLVLFERDENGNYSERAKEHEFFEVRNQYFIALNKNVSETAGMMDQNFNDYVGQLSAYAPRVNPILTKLVNSIKALSSTIKATNGITSSFAKMMGIRCKEWIEQYDFIISGDDQSTTPQRNDKHKAKVEAFASILKDMDEYKNAVKDHSIYEPFTWNSKAPRVELARFLKPLVLKTYPDSREIWTYVDGLFTHKGKRITGYTLSHDLAKTYNG